MPNKLFLWYRTIKGSERFFNISTDAETASVSLNEVYLYEIKRKISHAPRFRSSDAIQHRLETNKHITKFLIAEVTEVWQHVIGLNRIHFDKCGESLKIQLQIPVRQNIELKSRMDPWFWSVTKLPLHTPIETSRSFAKHALY